MKLSQTTMLIELAAHSFELFHDPAGNPWAFDGTDTLRIGSRAFDERLARELFLATEKRIVPGKQVLSGAVNTLRGIARWDGPETPVYLRQAVDPGRVVLDLADDERRVVVVTANGREVTTDSPVRFYRPERMLALPAPEEGGKLEALQDLWPLGEDALTLVWGWLLGCFTPTGGKPLLDLAGTQGSGKSSLAKMLRSLVDPNGMALQTAPTDVRNLAVILGSHAVAAFDNVSNISEAISDALCRVATGAGFEHRKLYTDDEIASFSGIRPVILTGIGDLARQGDLADRTITIALPEIDGANRRTEAKLQADFEALRPGLLGLLLDGVECALGNLDTTVLPEPPRMADFATWVEAGGAAFGWERGTFLAAYLTNRGQASATVLESSYVAQFVPELADEAFTGFATDAMRRIEDAHPDAPHRHGYPWTPAGFRQILQRLIPDFRREGIVIQIQETGRRPRITIRRAGDAGSADNVVSLARKTGDGRPDPDDVVRALRAAGVDASWGPSRAAGVALVKAAGNAYLAARALNEIGVASPGGGPWTAEAIRSVV